MENSLLTPEQQWQVAETVKIFDSFEHFCTEYVWIEDKTTGAAIRFALWPGQKKILPKLLYSRQVISLKARQLGITWLVSAYSVWLALTRTMQEIVLISAKGEWAREVTDRIWFIYQRLPDWQKLPVVQKNTERITLEHFDLDGRELHSTIKSLTTTEEGAQSKTPTLLVMDESARNPFARQIFANSKPGIDAGGGQIVVISNAHQDGPGWGWTRDTYVGAMRGENDFQTIFMPWWDRPDRPRDFREIQQREGMHPDDVKQQYPETEDEAVASVFGSYFAAVLPRHTEQSPGTLGHLVGDDNPRTAIWEPSEHGPLCVWALPYYMAPGWDGHHWQARYAIGSDVSEGLGQSYSVAYVMDRLEDRIIARLRSNRVDAFQWAGMLYRLSCWYGNPDTPALICAERTGAGQTTVKQLKELRAMQYTKRIPDKATNTWTDQLGWSETHQAKHELCGDLFTWLRTSPVSIPCAILKDELATFIRYDNGVLGPEEGKFSDCVFGAGCMVQASIYLGEAPRRLEENVIVEKAKNETMRNLDDGSRRAWEIHQELLQQIEREQQAAKWGGW